MHKNPTPFVELAKKVGFCDDFDNQFNENTFEPVPCHRVVNASGKMGANFGMGGPEIQEKMLKAEGVQVENGRVDLNKYGF